MRAFEFVLMIAMFAVALWGGVIGASLYLLGRYLQRHHPREWKQLGSPDLYTAQGPRRSRINEWLRTDRYQKLHDAKLIRWVPVMQKLPGRLGVIVGCLALAVIGLSLVSLF